MILYKKIFEEIYRISYPKLKHILTYTLIVITLLVLFSLIITLLDGIMYKIIFYILV